MNRYYIDVQKKTIAISENKDGRYEPIKVFASGTWAERADKTSAFLATLPDQDEAHKAVVRMLEEEEEGRK